jgi:hypothetical protein
MAPRQRFLGRCLALAAKLRSASGIRRKWSSRSRMRNLAVPAVEHHVAGLIHPSNSPRCATASESSQKQCPLFICIVQEMRFAFVDEYSPLHAQLESNRSRVSEGDRPIFAGGREFNGTSRPPQPVVSAVKMRQSPARERLHWKSPDQIVVGSAADELRRG